MKVSFAGFIITYERPGTVKETIFKILGQTLPPQKLWIIDNSESIDTQNLVTSLNDEHLVYVRTGANIGPAGAAEIGLKMASDAGYEWIFWGDDDDPPPFDDTFERLLEIIASRVSDNIGQVGLVGQHFNYRTGIIRRVTDQELTIDGFLRIDTIAGGQCKIVNAAAVKKGCKPTAKLFFGFEELDFDIQLHGKGFSSWVRTDLYRLQRYSGNRLAQIQTKLLDEKMLWRQYYSLRNLLHIFVKRKMYFAFINLIVRRVFKSLLSFRFGIGYGFSLCKFTMLGIFHWLIGKYGYHKFKK